jgi:hypothetical protein
MTEILRKMIATTTVIVEGIYTERLKGLIPPYPPEA